MSQLLKYDLEAESSTEQKVKLLERGIKTAAEETEGCTHKRDGSTLVFESPSGGQLRLKPDDRIKLSIDTEDVEDETSFHISDLTKISFDMRPDNDQYRIITFGDVNMDFGL